MCGSTVLPDEGLWWCKSNRDKLTQLQNRFVGHPLFGEFRQYARHLDTICDVIEQSVLTSECYVQN